MVHAACRHDDDEEQAENGEADGVGGHGMSLRLRGPRFRGCRSREISCQLVELPEGPGRICRLQPLLKLLEGQPAFRVMVAKQRRQSVRLESYAQDIGLDMAKFTQDIENPAYKKTIAREINEGTNAGVNGTPTFYINGKKYNGAVEPERLKPILAAEAK